MKNQKVYNLAAAAVIAALYAALTIAIAPFGFGSVQFRISEALTILPLFTAVAVPGLTVGCFMANLIGVGMGLTMGVDVVFGTAASLLAAALTYFIGKSGRKWVRCLIGPLPAVVVNALVIGAEITLFFTEGQAGIAVFAVNAATVFLGQLLACYGLGVPLMLVLERNGLHKKIFKTHARVR